MVGCFTPSCSCRKAIPSRTCYSVFFLESLDHPYCLYSAIGVFLAIIHIRILQHLNKSMITMYIYPYNEVVARFFMPQDNPMPPVLLCFLCLNIRAYLLYESCVFESNSFYAPFSSTINHKQNTESMIWSMCVSTPMRSWLVSSCLKAIPFRLCYLYLFSSLKH